MLSDIDWYMPFNYRYAFLSVQQRLESIHSIVLFVFIYSLQKNFTLKKQCAYRQVAKNCKISLHPKKTKNPPEGAGFVSGIDICGNEPGPHKRSSHA